MNPKAIRASVDAAVAVAAEDLHADADAASLVTLLEGFLLGPLTQARHGVATSELNRASSGAMAL